MRKLGITLRLSHPRGYDEPRDGLARDWYRFLAELGRGNNWILLPNLGVHSVDYARAHGIEGFVFSGGDNIGTDALRDAGETALLEYAISARLPVLGICRGLQIIHAYFGGSFGAAEHSLHVAQRHMVLPCPEMATLPWLDCPPQPREVNSFHGNALASPLPLALRPWARDETQICEAVLHTDLNIAGIMWHPEREATFAPSDQQLFRWIFK